MKYMETIIWGSSHYDLPLFSGSLLSFFERECWILVSQPLPILELNCKMQMLLVSLTDLKYLSKAFDQRLKPTLRLVLAYDAYIESLYSHGGSSSWKSIFRNIAKKTSPRLLPYEYFSSTLKLGHLCANLRFRLRSLLPPLIKKIIWRLSLSNWCLP